jgi:hypothetical protein
MADINERPIFSPAPVPPDALPPVSGNTFVRTSSDTVAATDSVATEKTS